MPRTLLLDLDGTLVDTVPDLAAALNRLMASRGLPAFTAEAVTRMVGDGVAALVAKAFAAHDRSADPTAVADFTRDYEAHIAVASRLYSGVAETLASLKEQGWQLAICTNKPEKAARLLIGTLGLMPLICAVGAGDSFAARKPDPAHLLATIGRAGGQAGRAVMLGDHHNDIQAAAAAHVPGIFALWGYGTAAMAEGSTARAKNIADAAAIANRLLPG